MSRGLEIGVVLESGAYEKLLSTGCGCMLKLLTKEEYMLAGKKLAPDYWNPGFAKKKWGYHQRAIDLIQKLNLTDARRVLEMGTMGIQVVQHSDTLDFADEYPFEGKNPTYVHDGKVLPWPISDDRYELFIALRVFQHLAPVQQECFLEARRISRYQLLVVPYEYHHPQKGIIYDEFVEWLDGVHPNHFEISSQGALYFWDRENPCYAEKRSRQDKWRMSLARNKTWIRKVPFALTIHKMLLRVRAALT